MYYVGNLIMGISLFLLQFLRSTHLREIYIKIHAILSVRLSVLFFNPLPMNQFESQKYLWNSLNMAEILRLF